MANHELWQQQPAADARNREVEFGRTEQQTQALMQLANSIVHMLFYITGIPHHCSHIISGSFMHVLMAGDDQ